MNLSPEGQRIYDRATDARPAGWSPKESTAKTFMNARAKTEQYKTSECSNFARHAIGTLIEIKEITDQYNIIYAGIMEGAHNVAILVPIDKPLTLIEQGKKKAPILSGGLPQGSLFIDPWAYGMGKEFHNSFCCTEDEFAFNDALDKITIHYQSINDLANVEQVQKTAEQTQKTAKQAHETAKPAEETVKHPDTPIQVQQESASSTLTARFALRALCVISCSIGGAALAYLALPAIVTTALALAAIVGGVVLGAAVGTGINYFTGSFFKRDASKRPENEEIPNINPRTLYTP